MIGQPYSIVGDVELEAGTMHAVCINPEDNWNAVALADDLCGGFIDREVNLLAGLRRQPI